MWETRLSNVWIWIIRYQKCRPFKSRLIKRASRWIRMSLACFEENYTWIAFSRFSIQSAFTGLIRPSFVCVLFWPKWCNILLSGNRISTLIVRHFSLHELSVSQSFFAGPVRPFLPFPISSTQFLYLPPINLYFHASFRQLIILASFLPLNTIMNASAAAAAMSNFISPNHSFIWLGLAQTYNVFELRLTAWNEIVDIFERKK